MIWEEKKKILLQAKELSAIRGLATAADLPVFVREQEAGNFLLCC